MGPVPMKTVAEEPHPLASVRRAAPGLADSRAAAAGWRVLRPLRRILRVVGAEHHDRLAWVFVLTIGVGILEFVSIGALFPLLTLIFDPAAAGGDGIWRVVGWLGVQPGEGRGLVRLAVLVLGALVVKV